MKAEVLDPPLFAEYDGARFTSGRMIARRVRCGGCQTLFLPYLAEGDDTLRPVVLITDHFAACPRCGNGRRPRSWGEFHDLHVRLSNAQCSLDCERARGSECTCSCFGANHGIQTG